MLAQELAQELAQPAPPQRPVHCWPCASDRAAISFAPSHSTPAAVVQVPSPPEASLPAFRLKAAPQTLVPTTPAAAAQSALMAVAALPSRHLQALRQLPMVGAG